MKKGKLSLALAVCFSLPLVGCGMKNVIKQDPKDLVEHCKNPKFKDSKICEYLSRRDKFDQKIVNELYRIRDLGLLHQTYGKDMYNAATAYSKRLEACRFSKLESDDKHDEELMKLGALKK